MARVGASLAEAEPLCVTGTGATYVDGLEAFMLSRDCKGAEALRLSDSWEGTRHECVVNEEDICMDSDFRWQVSQTAQEGRPVMDGGDSPVL